MDNVIGKVAMAYAKQKVNRHDVGFDVNSTAYWGDTQPTNVRLMIPGSKLDVQSKTVIRMRPLLNPAHARIKARQWHYFVPCQDLTKNFNAMMAQTQVNHGGNSYIPTQLPIMQHNILCANILVGAKASLYRVITDGDYSRYTIVKSGSDEARNIMNNFVDAGILERQSDEWSSYGPKFTSRAFNLSKVGHGLSRPNVDNWIPLDNIDDDSFFRDDSIAASRDFNPGFVAPNGSHISIPVDIPGKGKYAVMFRLSAFGKRIRKILIGCGIQINLTCLEHVDLLPIFAYYRAYFDVFGLELYRNWETTAAARILAKYDYSGESVIFEESPLWHEFIYDLGHTWVTSQQDFVSAHIPSTAISPVSGAASGFVDVQAYVPGSLVPSDAPIIKETDSSNYKVTSAGDIPAQHDGQPYIQSVNHSHLSEEYLKLLYRWVNRNTVIGKRVEELLRAQGLGDFVDGYRAHFIGYDETLIPIDDVISNSDTFVKAADGSTSGSPLGDTAGRGVKFFEGRHHKFKTNEFGYWITLFAIYPDCGYSQAQDPTVYAYRKLDFYHPEYDSKGMELSRKSIVTGADDWTTSENSQVRGFGYIPRYMPWKVGFNKLNGDFSLHGERDVYLPFTCDKFVSSEEKLFTLTSTPGEYVCEDISTAKDLSAASLVWRFPTRYPWISNLSRIFAVDERIYSDLYGAKATDPNVLALWEMTNGLSDPFFVQQVVNAQYYAPMLAREESFGTEDDNGNFNASLSKA